MSLLPLSSPGKRSFCETEMSPGRGRLGGDVLGELKCWNIEPRRSNREVGDKTRKLVKGGRWQVAGDRWQVAGGRWQVVGIS